MRKTLFILLLTLVANRSISQTDTLYTQSNKKISCIILELNEKSVVYKITDPGPEFVVSLQKISKYVLSNGYTEYIQYSVLIEKVNRVTQNLSVIKLHPFSSCNNQISMSYETVIRSGLNVEIEAGYINNELNGKGIINGNNFYASQEVYKKQPAGYSGGYVKPGIKFFINADKKINYSGTDFIKGSFLRFDLVYSYLSFQNLMRTDVFRQGFFGPVSTLSYTTDVVTYALGTLINYGYQTTLADILTLEYYFGVGYTGRANRYSNPGFMYTPQYVSSHDYAHKVTNYHGFVRNPDSGFSVSFGFRLGYIIKPRRAQKNY